MTLLLLAILLVIQFAFFVVKWVLAGALFAVGSFYVDQYLKRKHKS